MTTVDESRGGAPFVPQGRSTRVHAWWSAALVLLVATACANSATSGVPSPTGRPLSLPALKLGVLDAVAGHLSYCDPDEYPVAHGTPLENAQARFPTIQADGAAFDAILAHEHLSAGQQFTADELIA